MKKDGPAGTADWTNHKLRTRRALIEAANRLLAEGKQPTLAEVAATALVSRATAYRYYPSLEALVEDAFFDRQAASPAELFADDCRDPAERVLRVEEAVNGLLLSHEVAMHIIVRNFVSTWLAGVGSTHTPRPARRLPLLRAALEPFRARLGDERTERLVGALAMTVGTEALMATRDVCLLDRERARAVTRWACQALVCQAFDETA